MAYVPMIPAQDGAQGNDKYYTQVPLQADTTLALCKDPAAGSFIALTTIATGLGYVKVQDRNGLAKRLIMTDHPDGG